MPETDSKLQADETASREIQASRLALKSFFRAEDWNFPFRLGILAVSAAVFARLGVGAGYWIWLALTVSLETAGHVWRLRVRRLRWSDERLRRFILTNDLLGHAILLGWLAGAAGLYIVSDDTGRMAAMLMLAGMGMTVARQPGRRVAAMWINVLLPSIAMILLTAQDLDSQSGLIRFVTAFLFSANILALAFVSQRQTAAMYRAHAVQEALIEEVSRARDEALAERNSAERSARLKTDFLAVMSHEIRTPLNGVLAMSRVLARSRLDPEQAGQVRAIEESGRMLMRIVTDILDLSRAESGRMTLHPERVDIDELLGDGLAIWRIRAREEGLAFEAARATDVPRFIMADDVRLRQILFNLLGNALKFTERGGVAVRVDLAGGMLRFAVEDSGPGIAPEHLDRVFDRFARVEVVSSRRADGSGLGLAIARELVELMGGGIEVESEVGRGSIFRFEIPLTACDQAAPVPEPAGDATRDQQGIPRGLRILVADDNAINQAVAAAILAPLEPDIVRAMDGRAAVEAVVAERFDLVLMDVRMPHMDGIEATRRIRATSGGKDVPIVALTAGDEVRDRQPCLDAGADAFLTKPIDSDVLHRLVAELTRRDREAAGRPRPAA